ncbi:hypothetical protein M3Y97_00637200 [Aphelenchoides bicaudatus]|nr:hypothetical protein M3Y97_00637200 [Aphelenchoides bicaudatus]
MCSLIMANISANEPDLTNGWYPSNLQDGLANTSTSVCWEADDFTEFSNMKHSGILGLIFLVVMLIGLIVMVVYTFMEHVARLDYANAKRRRVKPRLTPDYLTNISIIHEKLR